MVIFTKKVTFRKILKCSDSFHFLLAFLDSMSKKDSQVIQAVLYILVARFVKVSSMQVKAGEKLL
jgi:hypothetical protein